MSKNVCKGEKCRVFEKRSRSKRIEAVSLSG